MFGLYTLRISEERYLKVDSFIQSSFQNKISPNRNIFRIVSHKPQCCNIEGQSVSLISYTFILISNFSYSTTAFIRGRFSLQNHGKSIHLKSIWLSSSRLKKRISFIMSFMETNRRGIFFFGKKITPSVVPHMRWIVHPCQWNHFSCQKKTTGLLMNYVAGGIPSAVAVLQESWHLQYSIISLYCFISGICSGCMLLFSKGTPAYSFNRCCFVIFRGFSTEQNAYLNIN